MKMTPTVIIVGILSLLAAITLTIVYWPYATRYYRAFGNIP